MFTASNLYGQLLFSTIGAGAFLYGKKQQRLRPSLLGVALMVSPYFFSETWMVYLIGAILTAALFLGREES
jgi:hypothetical protein